MLGTDGLSDLFGLDMAASGEEVRAVREPGRRKAATTKAKASSGKKAPRRPPKRFDEPQAFRRTPSVSRNPKRFEEHGSAKEPRPAWPGETPR